MQRFHIAIPSTKFNLYRMTQFKFEGDYESLSEPQLKLVESALQKQGFKDGTVLVEPVGQKGDNYVANVKRFIYKTSDGSLFKMIAKVAPTDEQLRLLMNTLVLFTNEIIMYEEVLPKLKEIQNSAGISNNEKVRFPTCFGVVREAPHELILLEDLKESDFEMLDRFQPLNNNTIKLSLKGLAIFHSLSYALKNTEPDSYKNLAGRFVNMWTLLDKEPAASRMFEESENQLKQLVENEKYRQIITGSISQIAPRARKMDILEANSKYTVIQHGDCWSNNILFRLEEGKTVDNVMIDYQLSKQSNPVMDVLYLIINCTDHETRIKHFQEWVDYYHEVLDDSLANFGLKANRIFPRDRLDSDLRRYGKLMLGLGILISSVLVRESKDVVDFKQMEGVTTEEMTNTAMEQMSADRLDMATMMKLKVRVEGIIKSSLELGLI